MNRTAETAAMLWGFLSQFAPAYRGALPAGITPEAPYITYTGNAGNLCSAWTQALQIYQLNTTSFAEVHAIADALEEAIGECGLLLHSDAGLHMRIHKGEPFMQDRPDENATTRACMVNLEITTY